MKHILKHLQLFTGAMSFPWIVWLTFTAAMPSQEKNTLKSHVAAYSNSGFGSKLEAILIVYLIIPSSVWKTFQTLLYFLVLSYFILSYITLYCHIVSVAFILNYCSICWIENLILLDLLFFLFSFHINLKHFFKINSE